MATKDLSFAAQSLLDSIVKNEGDVVIDAAQALEICGTSSRIRVKDMSDRQLLQYALLSTYGIAQRLGRAFEEAQRHAQLQMALEPSQEPVRLTRAQRREKERLEAKERVRRAKAAKERPTPKQPDDLTSEEVHALAEATPGLGRAYGVDPE
jgi:hypothetical protein